MLVLNSQYSNKQRISPQKSTSIEFRVTESDQKISTATNSIVLKDGNLKAAIPCMELARTLFLHNVHLARTALRPNGLQGMATVDTTQGESVIRLRRLSDYPLKNLDSKSACAHIRWLLLNPDAKRSFNSIYQELLSDQSPSWKFRFSPPPLKGWRFKLLGEFDQEDSMLFHVEEIKRVNTPYFDYGAKVSISHPKKRELIPVEPKNGKRPEVNRSDPEPQLDLQAIPGTNRKRDVVSEEGFRFICDAGDDVKVLPGADQAHVTPTVNMKEEPKPDVTGVGHAVDSGNAQELDWAINRDDVDEPTPPEAPQQVAPTDNFQVFEKMIQKLIGLPDYEHHSTQCLAMPKPDNNSLMYKNKLTQQPRTYHCAYFSYQNNPLVIIEVDISDIKDKHKLGSRLFGFSKIGKEGLMHVMKACSEKGVHWDASINQEHCSVVIEIKHPSRTKIVDGESTPRTESEYEAAWGEALHRAVRRAVFSNA
nr:Tn7-like element transposition protein TnsE [Vibrio brasiliensis]